MSELHVADRIFFMSDGFGFEPKVYASDDGKKKIYSGVPVFRSGTFRDSRGIQNTWEDLHIKQMVDNWDHLSGKNILASVPVRDGHKEWLVANIPGRGEVVGWHTDVEYKKKKSPVDGKEYTYIFTDYEITQQYAIEKIENRTWRNRSAEIGGYATNDEAEFWPVYLGFAFVDFSAVEGLNFSAVPQGTARFYAFIGGSSQEIRVSDNNTGQTGQTGSGLPFPVVPPTSQPAQHSGQPSGQPATQPQTTSQPFVFSVGGQNVTDPNQVQGYINQMEAWAKETREAGRKNFVASLVTANKITAPQKEGMEQFALTLSDDQYSAWMKQWDLAPAQSVLANHGSGVTNPHNSAQPNSQEKTLEDAEAVVRMHERAGAMSETDIKATKSYKLLVAAGRRSA